MITGTSGLDAFALGRSSRPLIPGDIDVRQNQDQRHGIGITDFLKRAISRIGEFHFKAAGTDVAPELLAKQVFDVGFIIDHEYKTSHE
ncbi:hypothetical protein ACVW0I_002586 [Bradyrhizobium sp. LM6.11]